MIRKLLFAAVVLALASSLATATSLVEMGFGDLAREAERIVVGTVTHVQGEWDDSGTFIHSLVTLQVDLALRGNASSEIVIRTPGGHVGSTAMQADGVAEFEIGERVFVFLTSWEDGTAKVLGYVQGKARVLEEPDGRLRLQGGRMDGRTLGGVRDELRFGPNHNIALRPVGE